MKTFAYELSTTSDGYVIDKTTNEPFPVEHYSRMKYGGRQETRAFAVRLAAKLLEHASDSVMREEPPRFLVQWKSVPTAGVFLAKFTMEEINKARISIGYVPGSVVQIFKSDIIDGEYSSMTEEDRISKNASIRFDVEPEAVHNQLVTIFDDIRITGCTEQRMLQAVTKHNPRSISFAYLASYDANVSLWSPAVEFILNTTVIKDISDIVPLIVSNNFDLNVRVLKLMMQAPAEDFRKCALRFPVDLLLLIVQGCLLNGRDFCLKYRENLDHSMTLLRAMPTASTCAASLQRLPLVHADNPTILPCTSK
jgi:hypothetical protein